MKRDYEIPVNILEAMKQIQLIPGIGNTLSETLLAYCGSYEGLAKTKKETLVKIPGIADTLADKIINYFKEH